MDEQKTGVKYAKFCASVEAILFAFSSSYMVESGFSHMHYLPSKQGSILNTQRSAEKSI